MALTYNPTTKEYLAPGEAPAMRVAGVSVTPGVPNAPTGSSYSAPGVSGKVVGQQGGTAILQPKDYNDAKVNYGYNDAQLKAAGFTDPNATPGTSGWSQYGFPGNPNNTDQKLFNAYNATRPNLGGGIGPDNVPVGSSQANDLTAKYNAANENLKKTGGPVADTIGAGMSAVNQSVQDTTQPTEPPNPMVDTLSQSPEYQQLLADHTAYLNSVNQRQSLTQEYQNLSTSLGLPQLNTDLINMKNVINGTETDIRNEITKAGGFATNSQVMALSSARNKVLIQNYNNLLETRNNAQQQLTTMIGLSEKDRAMADQQFQQQLNFDQQMVNFRQKAIDNSKSIYQTLLTNPNYGAKAILAATGGDPNTTRMVEQSLGLGAGGLQGMVNTQEQAQATSNLKDQLQIEGLRLENAKKRQDLSNIPGTPGAPGTPGTPEVPAQSAYQIQGNQRIIDSVDSLIPQISNFTAGFGGKSLSLIPGTPAYNFKSQLDTLKANIAFGALTQMREASKTGGALGQISDAEERLLSSTLGALDPGQSPIVLKQQLNKIKDSITKWNNAVSGQSGSQEGATHTENGVTYKVINGVWTPQ